MTKFKPTVDLGYPTEPHGRIPAFQNIEQEAEFWDTHDFTDFDDPDSVWTVYSGGRTEASDPLMVSLAPSEREALVERAREENVEPSTLATAWLQERLRQELDKKAS